VRWANPRTAIASSICLRNALITVSCIKLGNIPENSLTQAHQRPRGPHDQQRQSTIGQRGENSRQCDNHREAV
jgi:hypothetical protein